MKRILVIDDLLEVREVIADSLKMNGFTPLIAEDGLQGLAIARRENPDLIVCDINMPNLNGYETLNALRHNEGTATIPFIFVTGIAEASQIRKGMELGADDYLTKPFTPNELLAAIRARLEKQAGVERQSEKKLQELRGSLSLALPHELRTPLNGIMGLSSMLIEDYATHTKEEVLECARFIQESACRLHHLIENFLAFSHIELLANSPASVITEDPLTAGAVEEILKTLARQVAIKYERESNLEIDVVDGTVCVPAESLKKIVEELVDNAFKFSDAGTQVWITGRSVNAGYRFLVRNQGRGFTPEQIAKVGPHMQFNRDLHEQQGAGLGLIIAKRLTELHGGAFSIQSIPGQTTTVIAELPSHAHTRAPSPIPA